MTDNKGYHGHKDKKIRDKETGWYGTIIEDTRFNLKVKFEGQEGVSMFSIETAPEKLEGL